MVATLISCGAFVPLPVNWPLCTRRVSRITVKALVTSNIIQSVCLVAKGRFKERCGLGPRTNFFVFCLRNRQKLVRIRFGCGLDSRMYGTSWSRSGWGLISTPVYHATLVPTYQSNIAFVLQHRTVPCWMGTNISWYTTSVFRDGDGLVHRNVAIQEKEIWVFVRTKFSYIFIHDLLNDAVSSSDSIVPSCRMSDVQWSRNLSNISEFAWKEWKTPRIITFRKAVDLSTFECRAFCCQAGVLTSRLLLAVAAGW